MQKRPSKIICVGRTYAAHAKELGNEVPERPLLFLKPPSSIIADRDTIIPAGRIMWPQAQAGV